MTTGSFCSWVDDFLSNSNIKAGASAPCKISVEVARRWLLTMGFKVKHITKGVNVDGQERADVEDCGKFLKQ